MGKTIHLCQSVRGALLLPNKELRRMFRREGGGNMPAAEARLALMDALAQGHEVIPIGPPCEGFDNKKGCPGHPLRGEGFMKAMHVVFDLDGTLADCTHRLHLIRDKSPSDWNAFFQACTADAPIPHIVAIAQAMHAAGHRIEIWTGRSDEVLDETTLWLEAQQVPFSMLLMRRADDHRTDDAVKGEWLREDKPDLVFEDRARMVEMYRAAGVTCVQVAEGNS